MGIIDKMFKKEDKQEEVPIPEAEVAPEVEEQVDDSPVPEEPVVEEPAVSSQILTPAPPHTPVAPPNPVHDPDSNYKDPKTPSFL